MRIFQEKRRLKRIIFSKPSLIVMAILVAFAVISSLQSAFRAYIAYSEREKVQAEYEKLEKQKQKLEARINNLDNPISAEKEAKERFNVKKEGEEVLIIYDSVPGASTTEDGGKSNAFFEFFKKFFR